MLSESGVLFLSEFTPLGRRWVMPLRSPERRPLELLLNGMLIAPPNLHAGDAHALARTSADLRRHFVGRRPTRRAGERLSGRVLECHRWCFTTLVATLRLAPLIATDCAACALP